MAPERETRLREILSTIDPPASGISAAGLLEDGRRARRRRGQRRAAAAAGVVTLGVLAGVAVLADRSGGTRPEPPAATSASPVAVVCRAERLAVPKGATEGNVNTGSPSGRYLAGVVVTKDDPGLPVRWDGTRARVIPIDGTGEANGVNDAGVVVGDGQTAGRRHYAWAYAGGKVVELPIPKGYTGAEADAVNAAGLVVGVLFAGEKNTAAIWRSPTATARVDLLDAPGGAMAFGVSDTGVVVGGLADGSAAYEWDASGRGTALAGPAGTGGGGALGVRGTWAYGLLEDEGGGKVSESGVIDPNVAVVWDLSSGRARTVEGGRVGAIGAGGQIVVNPSSDERTAWIRTADGATRPLPGLTAKDKAHAYAISADGSRVGGDSAGHPVRWSCAAKASR